MYNQGDIVLMPFPYTDLTTSKFRPALIISNDSLNSTGNRICVLITSKRTKEGISIKSKDLTKKLPLTSWIKPHRIFSINEKIIKKRLSTVSKTLHLKVLEEINNKFIWKE